MKNDMLLDRSSVDAMTRIFKALSDASRLRIVDLIMKKKKLCVTEIAEELQMSISNVSHHLSKLSDLGFVIQDREGKQTFQRITDRCIKDIVRRAEAHVCGE